MKSTIKELYDKQKEYWKWENEHFFGLTPIDDSIIKNPEKINEHLQTCCENFYNEGTCELKRIIENGKCNDIKCMVPKSYELVYDSVNNIICLYAKFSFKKENKETKDEEETIKRSPLCYLPVVDDLCWWLNTSQYILRISASINYSILSRTDNIVRYQRSWEFDCDTREFKILSDSIDPYENLTLLNEEFLETCYGKPVTRDNFEDALCTIPEFKKNSIANFRFSHVDGIFKFIRESKRFINPIKVVPIPLNIVKMISSQINSREEGKDSSFLILNTKNNKISALENSRTVLYNPSHKFNNVFLFHDTVNFFDAFKTSTNTNAGRSRMLLDDISIKNGVLYKKVNGQEYDMYRIIKDGINFGKSNLSALSSARFGMNDASKRIMMRNKLRPQAVKLKNEIDPFTHEIPARVVFGDFEGFNEGDAIIISKSFAKKLTSETRLKINLYRSQMDYLIKNFKVGDSISPNDLLKIKNQHSYSNYRNIKIVDIGSDYFEIEADIPFSVGDKITNMHGAKGIATIILEDDQMPYLKDDIEFNGRRFEKGPFEVIISLLSVYKRQTLGQLFEAWALAMDVSEEEANTIKDCFKFKEDIKYFCEHSVVCLKDPYTGEIRESIKPCGVNMILRLDQDATSKQSFSYLQTNYGRMLKFEEMAILNLAARGMYGILNETDIRSCSKHYNAFEEINLMQRRGDIELETADNTRFFNILKIIGYDFNLNHYQTKILNNSEMFNKIQELIDNNEINLF